MPVFANCNFRRLKEMPHWPSSTRYRAVGMMEAGMPSFEVSLCLNVPVATVYRWFHRFRAEGRIERHQGSGRPVATTQRADRRLLRLARRNRFAPSSALLNLWDEPVSGLTVRRRLCAAGLRPRRPLRRPQLSQRHRQLRLRWAMARFSGCTMGAYHLQ